MADIKELMYADAELVEAALREYYAENDEDFGVLLDAEKYSLFAGGKRIRPFLVIEFCKLFGGEAVDALPFAAAIEMIHTSSLIHDDLPCMDDDDLRRGKPTNHKVFGYANALLAGDALLLRAFETMAGSTLPDRTVRGAVAALACSAGDFGMVGGQVIDLRGENEKLSLDTLKKLHKKKTGALIRCSALLGCLAAGLDFSSDEAQAACEYADAIGLAFQIVDDILDATGDEATLGKSTGSDADAGKTTFLSYYTPDEAYEYAKELTLDAKRVISSFEGSEALCDLAQFLLDRKF